MTLSLIISELLIISGYFEDLFFFFIILQFHSDVSKNRFVCIFYLIWASSGFYILRTGEFQQFLNALYEHCFLQILLSFWLDLR